ncbi:MAG: GreA/GreB family elongation factor, partial [Sulfurimicrobium sp.]|nr:GreA/GreB family elongation factor [Sulfurimicrobium sp.]
VIDPAERVDCDQVFFGATVTVSNPAGEEKTYSIVGLDEVDVGRGRISWVSPLAKSLLKAREGDGVTLRTPGGVEELEVVEIRYEALD